MAVRYMKCIKINKFTSPDGWERKPRVQQNEPTQQNLHFFEALLANCFFVKLSGLGNNHVLRNPLQCPCGYKYFVWFFFLSNPSWNSRGGKQKILRFAEMCHKLFRSAMHLQNAIGTGSLLILAAGSASKCEQMIIFWEDSHQPT